MFACDVVDDDYREIKHRATLQLGNNPRAVRVSPDSRRSTFTTRWISMSSLTTSPVSPRWRRFPSPKIRSATRSFSARSLFYTALQPMVGRRWISCSSCHPDGEADGRTWQNPEGLRNTTSLAGMAWTHPLHWSADRDEVQDFEHTIRGPLMQGRGLIRGKVNPELGAPEQRSFARTRCAGRLQQHAHRSAEPPRKGGLSESAKRGREIFFSKQTQCATCHSGPYFTDSTPRETILVHDVGTGADDPTEKKGPAYDTPTLLGIYKTAPYLHHGKAATLKDVLTTFNHNDRHGKTSQLSAGQIDDLVEFLKALPYEDPEPKAKALGMKKIERSITSR